MADPFDFAATEGEGIANVRALTDQARTTAAYNALRKQYGDVAGDPAANDTLQKTNQNAQDYQRQAALRAALVLKGVSDSGGDVGDAYNKFIRPNPQVFGIDPEHVDALGQMLAGPDGGKHLDDIISGLRGVGKPVGAPITLVGPDGLRHTYVRDSVGNMTEVGGTDYKAVDSGTRADTGVKNADTNRFSANTRARQGDRRLNIQQQNADTGTYRADVTGSNSTFGAQGGAQLPAQGGGGAPAPAGGVAPAPAVAPGPSAGPVSAAPPDIALVPLKPTNGAPPPKGTLVSPQAIDKLIKDNGIGGALKSAPNDAAYNAIASRYNATIGKSLAAPAPNAPSPTAPATSQPTNPKALFWHLPPKGRQQAIGEASAIANQATNLHNVNNISDQVNHQISAWTTGFPGVSFAHLPGSVQNDLKKNLDTLGAQGLNAWIASLKNGKGQTGIGRILQSEVDAAKGMFGALEQSQTPGQMHYHLRMFQKAVNDLYAHAHQAYGQVWQVSPEEAMNGGGAAPSNNSASGFTYLGVAK